MGMLLIRTWGSFRPVEKTFKAQTSGHVVAVEDAIAFLQQFKEEAEIQDSRLRREGCMPDDDFAVADARKAEQKAKDKSCDSKSTETKKASTAGG